MSETMDAKALLKERKEIITDVVRQQKLPKRIPLMSQVRAWPILDAGYKLSMAYKNLDISYQIIDQFQARYNFDCHFDPYLRFNYKVYEAMGYVPYIFDDEKEVIQADDVPSMDADEYAAMFEKGTLKFYFENFICRRFKLTDKETAIRAIAKATEAQQDYGVATRRIIKNLAETYGVPSLRSGVIMSYPIQGLFSMLRGLKGFSLDIRRRDQDVLKAMEVMDNGACERLCKSIENYEIKENEVFACSGTINGHVLLNPDQFGRYVWPGLKRYIDATVKADKLGMIFMQGQIGHLIKYFAQIPKGHFLLVVEEDDIRKLRKELPNLSFAGGFPVQVLGFGTEQECIDHAKRMIDEIGYDGRLMFSTNKMVAYRNDAKRNNLIAVNNFVREYGVYK
ncbi:MAG: hypothetical protein LBL79_12565 [Prevotella sp.]|jgi:hypothetical protein|nr:hypothetical protein [Prevotella sp.]